MEKLTDEERYVLSMIGMVERKLSELSGISKIDEYKLISIINSINKKTDNLIKEKDGLYYADERARELFLHDIVDEMKNDK